MPIYGDYDDIVSDMLHALTEPLIDSADPHDNALGGALLAVVRFANLQTSQEEFESDMAYFVRDIQQMHAEPAEAERP